MICKPSLQDFMQYRDITEKMLPLRRGEGCTNNNIHDYQIIERTAKVVCWFNRKDNSKVPNFLKGKNLEKKYT